MESSTYAMKTIETIFPLAETDAEYVKMCEYLLAYSLEVEEICENIIALDLPNSYVLLSPLTDGFFTMLTNLILDIDSAADNLKLATAYLEP